MRFVGVPETPGDIAGDVFIDYERPDIERQKLPLYLDEVNHSPTGFAWNYYGSGPAQLAYAILRHVTNSRNMARRLYQRFEGEHIARLGKGEWAIDEDLVTGWIWEQEEQDAATD